MLNLDKRTSGKDTIKEANKYLTEVFEICPSEEKINYTLAVLSPRKIDNGNSIKYKKVLSTILQ